MICGALYAAPARLRCQSATCRCWQSAKPPHGQMGWQKSFGGKKITEHIAILNSSAKISKTQAVLQIKTFCHIAYEWFQWTDDRTDRLKTLKILQLGSGESSHPPPAAQLSICHVFFISCSSSGSPAHDQISPSISSYLATDGLPAWPESFSSHPSATLAAPDWGNPGYRSWIWASTDSAELRHKEKGIASF